MQIVIDIPEEKYISLCKCVDALDILGMSPPDPIILNAIAKGIPLPKGHGRLIDADALHDAMYHRAFETDGDTMWQSGCWVRYRAIESVQNEQPTVIEAETL